MILYIETAKESIRNLLELIKEFSIVLGHNTNMQKSAILLALKHGFEMCRETYTGIFSVNTSSINVFSLPYNFLNNAFSSGLL